MILHKNNKSLHNLASVVKFGIMNLYVMRESEIYEEKRSFCKAFGSSISSFNGSCRSTEVLLQMSIPIHLMGAQQ